MSKKKRDAMTMSKRQVRRALKEFGYDNAAIERIHERAREEFFQDPESATLLVLAHKANPRAIRRMIDESVAEVVDEALGKKKGS